MRSAEKKNLFGVSITARNYESLLPLCSVAAMGRIESICNFEFKLLPMNKLLPIALGLFLVISDATVPATAVTSSASCNQTLKSVRKSLSGVVSFQTNALGNQGQPRGRTKVLNIIFKNGTDLTIAAQKAIATRVIRNCNQIAAVSFGVDQTDGVNIYGLKKNQIIEFTCVDTGIAKKLVWGEHYCI
jgi:hypothetical protein